LNVPEEVNSLAARVKLLLMDVDGVMTDGRIHFLLDTAGNVYETKGFDSHDGIALQWLRWHGIQTGLISGRISPATETRARQCHFSYIYQGHIEKIPILEEIMTKSGLARDEIAYIGDDLTDIVVMRRVGFAVATANARPEVKECAHWVTDLGGGRGAIRQVSELLLRAQGHWQDLLRKYEVTV
jgi:3-deoxy-D-manno-octulosonate 8-phosphate phosphatase (KDO 8-P phosphatase)